MLFDLLSKSLNQNECRTTKQGFPAHIETFKHAMAWQPLIIRLMRQYKARPFKNDTFSFLKNFLNYRRESKRAKKNPAEHFIPKLVVKIVQIALPLENYIYIYIERKHISGDEKKLLLVQMLFLSFYIINFSLVIYFR